MLKTLELEYQAGEVLAKAYVSYDDNFSQLKPAVIIAHDWAGRGEFSCQKARQLAEQGYVGFALDMYGNAKVASGREEKSALLNPLKANRKELLTRVTAAYQAVQQLDFVDKNKIAAIGYCFGGMCVLDLARSGATVNGVVSFHGILTPPPEQSSSFSINSKILVLHGYDDVLVPPQQVLDFSEEMNSCGANWQLYTYGCTAHSFTNPEANDDELGLHYSAEADRRSRQAAELFFTELFD